VRHGETEGRLQVLHSTKNKEMGLFEHGYHYWTGNGIVCTKNKETGLFEHGYHYWKAFKKIYVQ
jgi:hypothetical protein